MTYEIIKLIFTLQIKKVYNIDVLKLILKFMKHVQRYFKLEINTFYVVCKLANFQFLIFLAFLSILLNREYGAYYYVFDNLNNILLKSIFLISSMNIKGIIKC